jgi:hypothetical protein
LLGDLLQLRSRIGDRDEMLARRLATEHLRGALEEVLLEDVGIEGGSPTCSRR